MKPPPFEYVRPESLEEAIETLRAADGTAKILAGGQSLVPMMAFRLIYPSMLIDISQLPGLSGIQFGEGFVRIGALATHRSVELHHELRNTLPLVSEAVGHVGHVSIRNAGTVGGSIAHADPAAEWPAVALALDAEIEICGPERMIRATPAQQFFRGWMEVDLGPGEVVIGLRLPLPEKGHGWGFQEVSRRAGDFAICGVAAIVELDGGTISGCRVAVLGADLTPVRAKAVEHALCGQEVDDLAGIAKAAMAIESDISPLDDQVASAAYRLRLAPVLVERAVVQAVGRA